MNAIAIKQELHQKIDQMPNELSKQLLDYANELETYYDIPDEPDNLLIKDRKDLINCIKEGLKDVKAGRVFTLEEAFDYIDSL